MQLNFNSNELTAQGCQGSEDLKYFVSYLGLHCEAPLPSLTLTQKIERKYITEDFTIWKLYRTTAEDYHLFFLFRQSSPAFTRHVDSLIKSLNNAISYLLEVYNSFEQTFITVGNRHGSSMFSRRLNRMSNNDLQIPVEIGNGQNSNYSTPLQRTTGTVVPSKFQRGLVYTSEITT